jgi:SAM-dependent methyltransferase
MTSTEMRGTGKPASVTWDDERTHPETPDQGTFQHHLARYEFALRQMRRGEAVLDTGCGVGYGTFMLAKKARETLGVDYSMPALARARERYAAPHLSYARMDCQRLALRSGSFDLVVSFEMFEHLEHGEDYLRECHRVLRPGGRLILSTPNRAAWEIHMRSIQVENEFHVNMVDLRQLRRALTPLFSKVDILGQRRRGSRLHSFLRALDIWNLRLRLVPPQRRERMQRAMHVPAGDVARGEDWIFDRSQLRQCNHFIAICYR